VKHRVLTLCALSVLAAGCAPFPHRREPLQLSGPAPLDSLPVQGGASWPAAEWWKRYQDPTLDQLIDMAIAGSPTLAAAHARFESAEQSVRLAAATSGAHVVANGEVDRQRLSDNGFIPPHLLGFTWYDQADLGLQASYTFDWWDKQRFAVEGAMDEARASQADRSASLLVLSSSVADTYFGWQADQNRLTLAREKESTVQQEGKIAAARIRAQLESDEDLQRADLALAMLREQIASLQGSASLRLVALAALLGKSQSQLPSLQSRPIPVYPGALPDDVKLDLISRRADITASRWRVEAAEKNLASARAEFFPDISINLLLGVSSVDVGKLLEYGSRVPMAGAAIHLPIFDAGRLQARYGGARAALDSAVSTYQDTVISAAREVATQATRLAQIDAQRQQRDIAVGAALRIKESAAARVRQGVTDSRTELTAAESWVDQRDALLQLDSAALSADIALQRALGGGYEAAQRLIGPPSVNTTMATP
jgi:outer membrane protein, multidrug efflux system